MTQSTNTISPLRQRMIEDMTMRRLAPATQRGYLRAVERFTRFYGASPDSADAEAACWKYPQRMPSFSPRVRREIDSANRRCLVSGRFAALIQAIN